MACKNVTNVVFLESRKGWLGLVFGGNFANYIWMDYKMLVACASDNMGKKYFSITKVMFSVVISNTLDQNITYMI